MNKQALEQLLKYLQEFRAWKEHEQAITISKAHSLESACHRQAHAEENIRNLDFAISWVQSSIYQWLPNSATPASIP